MKLIWETRRQFVVARYVAEHQQLLFRSDKGMGGETRMEILFGPVRHMNLGCLIYEQFNLYSMSPEELAEHSGGLCLNPPSSFSLYGIGGTETEVQGVIVASGYSSTEDDGDYWEPSGLLRFDS
ncbi:hypothetical protein AB0J38_14825 [Streptomyces sp. NPDC050095]|uniref:hypothetical protein n=1 Tax=unclassified Streptomyces TaxID=2593676 RepID=UPI0034304708